MLYVLAWWVVIQIIGLVALPLSYWLFRSLPDRGYAFARPVGLLLVSYVFWLGGSFGVLHNTWGGVLASLVLVGAASWWVYQRGIRKARKNQETPEASNGNDPSLGEFLRRNRALVLVTELLFALGFAGWALYRAYSPDIATAGGEKFMEAAFLNAILRSPRFPPHDPWLSGFAISYYYFGYLMMALLTRFSGVPANYAYNLGVPLLFALTLTGSFSLVYNLVITPHSSRPTRHITRNTSLLYALLGPLLVVLLGNLEGFFEWLHAMGWGSAGFWRWLDIKDLTQPRQPPFSFVPDRFIWWWRASRVIHDRDLLGRSMEVIDEFPFFSFMLGDMHPHVLALPFVLLALGLALNVLRGGIGIGRLGGWKVGGLEGWKVGRLRGILLSIFQLSNLPVLNLPVVELALLGLCLGALGFLNTWDMPTALFVLVAAFYLRQRLVGDGRAGIQALLFGGVVGALSVLFYVPFYISFRSQAGGALPNLFNVTRLHQYLVMFGPFVFVLLWWLAVEVRRAWPQWSSKLYGDGATAWIVFLVGPPLLLLLAFLPLLVTPAGQAFLQEKLNSEPVRQALGAQTPASLLGVAISVRLRDPWLWVVLSLVLAVVVALLGVYWRGDKEAGTRSTKDVKRETENATCNTQHATRDTSSKTILLTSTTSTIFVLLLAFTGLGLTYLVEWVYLRDIFGTRMNTVFKFYFQAWVQLGIASAYGAYVLLRRPGMGRTLFAVGFVLVVAAGLVYPIMAMPNRAGGFSHPPTLDGLAWIRRDFPDDYAAAQWLSVHAQGVPVPVILEKPSRPYGAYEYAGRISMMTGLPCVLGWAGHEHQWRGNYEEQRKREPDIQTIYTSLNGPEVLSLLGKYNVRYVVVGSLERRSYPQAGLDKFERLLDVVYRRGEVTIYRR